MADTGSQTYLPNPAVKTKEFYGEKGKVSKWMVYQGNFDENNPKAPYWPYGEVKLHCVSEWTSEHDSIEYYPPPCIGAIKDVVPPIPLFSASYGKKSYEATHDKEASVFKETWYGLDGSVVNQLTSYVYSLARLAPQPQPDVFDLISGFIRLLPYVSLL